MTSKHDSPRNAMKRLSEKRARLLAKLAHALPKPPRSSQAAREGAKP